MKSHTSLRVVWNDFWCAQYWHFLFSQSPSFHGVVPRWIDVKWLWFRYFCEYNYAELGSFWKSINFGAPNFWFYSAIYQRIYKINSNCCCGTKNHNNVGWWISKKIANNASKTHQRIYKISEFFKSTQWNGKTRTQKLILCNIRNQNLNYKITNHQIRWKVNHLVY